MTRLTKEEAEARRKAERDAYIKEVVAKAPPFTERQILALRHLLMGGSKDEMPPAPPSPHTLSIREIERLKREAKELPRAMAKDMEKCGMCELSRTAHHVQKTHGLFHDFVPMDPDQVIKIARKYKRLITKAEQKVAEAEAKL